MINSDSRDYVCRVCGLIQREKPWGEDGKTPSFEICQCCGVEFGYEDCTLESTKRYRNNWIGNGTPWFDPSAMPKNWTPTEQFLRIPDPFK